MLKPLIGLNILQHLSITRQRNNNNSKNLIFVLFNNHNYQEKVAVLFEKQVYCSDISFRCVFAAEETEEASELSEYLKLNRRRGGLVRETTSYLKRSHI